MPAIESDGRTIAYDRAGAGERAIVFSHNLLCDRQVFATHVERFRERYLVLNVDTRGHGESRLAAGSRFSTVDVAQDLLAVLEKEKVKKATFVGVSLGATASMEVAIRHPERVEGLVLMGATPLAASLGDSLKNRVLALGLRLLGPGAFVRSAKQVLFGTSFLQESPSSLAAWETRFRALEKRAAAAAVRAWISRSSLLERLPSVRARTLVVSGAEDVAHPPHLGELIARTIPGARFELLPRAGHTMTLERPEETAKLIEGFLVG